MQRTTAEVGARAMVFAAGLAVVSACATRKDFTAETEDSDAETGDVFRRGSKSLVRIETPHRVGGGFIVGANGVIVTSYSLLQHEVTARAVLADGKMFAVDRVLSTAPDRDLALVSIEARGLPVLALSRQQPTSGQRVIAVGHALGMAGPTVAESVVGSSSASGAFQITSPLPAGFFGAPVLDTEGRAVGMIATQRQDGASVLAAASIAGMLRKAAPNGGETVQAFGKRTRDADGWASSKPLDESLLDDCSMQSRERVWSEIETAIQNAAPVFDLGGTTAAQRVLEGAVLYLARDLEDCRKLMDVLVSAAEHSRGHPDAMEGTTLFAEALHAVLELLFTKSHALGPMAWMPAPSKHET